jgi:glycosyltransferase involved in cell wall biosynthesis
LGQNLTFLRLWCIINIESEKYSYFGGAMINVIIPAYNSHATIEKTIASIATQTIANKIEIILVDDCSEKNYNEITEKFKNIIRIREVRHEKNLGVGFARQTGLASVNQPYFGFSDSDDIYSDAFFFENSLKLMEENKNIIIAYSDFALEIEPEKYLISKHAMTSNFPKLYRTDFITKNNITFPKQNASEDTIFNKIIKLCLKENEIFYKMNTISYVWLYSKSSISRIREREYSYSSGPISFLQGFYHIDENKNINREEFQKELMSALFFTFVYYLDSKEFRYKEGFYKDILKEGKFFYKKFFQEDLKINEFAFKKQMESHYSVMYPRMELSFYNYNKFKKFLDNLQEDGAEN